MDVAKPIAVPVGHEKHQFVAIAIKASSYCTAPNLNLICSMDIWEHTQVTLVNEHQIIERPYHSGHFECIIVQT